MTSSNVGPSTQLVRTKNIPSWTSESIICGVQTPFIELTSLSAAASFSGIDLMLIFSAKPKGSLKMVRVIRGLVLLL